MTDIKLIEENTDISELKMHKFDWDVEVNGVSYQVVKIEGYVHSIGGHHGENDLWMYPRNGMPTYETLIEYQCDGGGVCWGIKYEPRNYIRQKWEPECLTSNSVMITRNGKDFYPCHSIDRARYLIEQLDEHPINLNMYNFTKKVIGRKVWWRSEPAIVTRWIDGQACVILEPDGIDHFSAPAEFADDEYYDDEYYIKTDIFDNHIWWFREK